MTASSNRSIPEGTFIPALSYEQPVGEVVAWLVGAFGVSERFRAGDDHAQIAFGDGGVLISGLRENLTHGNASYLTIRVDNLQGIYDRAKAFGAEITSEPTEYMYGELQFGAKDLGGHIWHFSQTMRDVDPAEWGATLPN